MSLALITLSSVTIYSSPSDAEPKLTLPEECTVYGMERTEDFIHVRIGVLCSIFTMSLTPQMRNLCLKFPYVWCSPKVERLEASERLDGWIKFSDLVPLNLPLYYIFAEGLPEVNKNIVINSSYYWISC